VPLLAEHVPEDRRAPFEGEVRRRVLLAPLGDLGILDPGAREPREVPLHVREKYRHARAAQLLGHHAQGDRLARARRTGDEAVAIRHLGA
jgi:hypothetical protein